MPEVENFALPVPVEPLHARLSRNVHGSVERPSCEKDCGNRAWAEGIVSPGAGCGMRSIHVARYFPGSADIRTRHPRGYACERRAYSLDAMRPVERSCH